MADAAPTSPDAISVVRDDAHHRYNAIVDGAVAGVAHYRVRDDKIILYHTVVEPEFEGKGIGSTLARSVLDDVRTRGERVTLECPFFAAFVKRHPEYADLVAP